MTDKTIKSIEVPDKLYGREEELKVMETLFKEKDHPISLVLIKAISGIGKTSLVRTFASRITSQENVLFFRGKQDFSENNQPFASLVQIFSKLIEHWVVADVKIELKEVFNSRLSHHSYTLTKLFPKLGEFFDEVDDGPRMALKDSVNEALLSLIHAIDELDQRMILFLDDLQWADESTLRFLELWNSEGKTKNLFLVAAYRTDEMSSHQRALLKKEHISRDSKKVVEIELAGLTLETIRELLRDTLSIAKEKQLDFSELVLQLTGGNPLFIRQSIPFLIEDNVLRYDTETMEWNYDVSNIKTFGNSSRTLEFIIRKMEMLPEDTVLFLTIGAAIGNTFSSTIVSAVSGKSSEEVNEALAQCVDRRMIMEAEGQKNVGIEKRYFFAHDKMQHAAYTLMTESRCEWVHYTIGKTYEDSLGNAAGNRHVYDIVNHYNRCKSHFNTNNDQLKLAEMNLQAGKKAKGSGSFDLALTYYNQVIHAIESNRKNWSSEIFYEVYLESGEAAYLKSDFVSSVMFFESALKYAQSDFEKAKVHHNFLVMYNGVSDMEAAWKSGRMALHYLGLEFPGKVSKLNVLILFLRVRWMISRMTSQQILDRPDIEDQIARQKLMTLMEMIPSAWDKKPEFLGFVVLKGLEIFLKNGNTPIGYFAISGYGALLGMIFGKIKKGWEYVQLGGQLTDKYDSLFFHGRGNFGVYGTYSHLVMHSKNNIAPLKDAFEYSKSAGDYGIASYSSIILVENMLAVGRPLDQLEKRSNSYLSFLKRTSNYDYLTSHKGTILFVKVLKEGLESFKNEWDKLAARVQRVSFGHIQYTWALQCLIVSVLFKDQGRMEHYLKLIREKGYRSLSSTELIHAVFVMSAAAESIRNKHEDRVELKKMIKKELKSVTKYSQLNPDNYDQIQSFLSGLLAELSKDYKRAATHFKEAARLAKHYEFIHFQSYFSECQMRCLVHVPGNEALIEQLRLECARSYQEWGANAKAKALGSLEFDHKNIS